MVQGEERIKIVESLEGGNKKKKERKIVQRVKGRNKKGKKDGEWFEREKKERKKEEKGRLSNG